MKSFHDTLKIEDAICPAECFLCQEKCQGRNTDTRGTGIKAVHLPELGFHAAMTCNQCGEPACEENCPTGAITKDADSGVVRVNQTKCLGCGLCSLVCPYGGIDYNADSRQAVKCDLCVHRLADNKRPACMSVCPTGCIHFGEKKSIAAVFENKT